MVMGSHGHHPMAATPPGPFPQLPPGPGSPPPPLALCIPLLQGPGRGADAGLAPERGGETEGAGNSRSSGGEDGEVDLAPKRGQGHRSRRPWGQARGEKDGERPQPPTQTAGGRGGVVF